MFNKNFLWGVATAAPQIEGSCTIDGKGKSVWDLYGEQKRIFHGQTPEDTPGSYLHLDEDIKLIKELGVKVYRFSFAWTRIIPNGIDSEVNQKGIDYYNKLIDSLLEIGVIPFATIFHWDLPLGIYEKGGYLNDDFPLWFERYTKVLLKYFGDRIKNWFTLNEPQCILGGLGGTDLERDYSDKERLCMFRNVLLAHSKAYKAIKEYSNENKVSVAFANSGFIPINEETDKIAAKTALFEADKAFNTWSLSLWADPIILGTFPQNFTKANFDLIKQVFTQDDLESINTGLDFYGLNNYFSKQVKTNDCNGFEIVEFDPNVCHTKNYEWPFSPRGLYWLVKFIYERYDLPIIVSENGICNYDIVCRDGKIHDNYRIEFIHSYLEELEKAYKEGVPVQGYFCWSLMDNLEWYSGTSERFGLVYTDFVTKKRTPKDSFYFFKELIRN